MWKMRDLTSIGRILVVKTLALSQLTYITTNLHTPTPYIVQVQNLINSFIWRDSTAKVKLDTISQPISEGGLKFPVFSIQVKALKLSFIKRICNTEPSTWKSCFQFLIPMININDIFESRGYLPEALFQMLPLFYQDLLRYWAELKCKIDPEPLTRTQVLEEYLWFNPLIKIDNKPVFYANWYKKGIKQLKHLLGVDNMILTDNELKNKYKLDFHFFEYFSLRQSIPYHWKNLIKLDKAFVQNPFF